MPTLKQKLIARLPAPQQVLPVSALIIFIVYSWVLYRFFFQLPSWLNYMKATNILILLAYSLSFSLVESLLILAFVVLLCVIFPARYFKDKFVAQGSFQITIITMIAYVLRQRIEEFSKMEVWLLAAIPLGLIMILVLSVVLASMLYDRLPILEKWISSLTDRMTIFLYLYTPLGALGMLVVILRNIF